MIDPLFYRVNAIYTGGKEVGNRICVEPLSDAVVFLNFLRADCGKMDQLASFTYALRKAFEELQERYTEFHKDEGPPDQTADFPYPLRETRQDFFQPLVIFIRVLMRPILVNKDPVFQIACLHVHSRQFLISVRLNWWPILQYHLNSTEC